MEESILNTIKKLMGIPVDYDAFDDQLIILINGEFTTLHQLGVGPVDGFQINDSGDLWEDYIGDDFQMSSVRTYIYLKVKLTFDPPQSSTVIQAYQNQVKELEWRLNTAYEIRGV